LELEVFGVMEGLKKLLRFSDAMKLKVKQMKFCDVKFAAAID
jgi:hypothetical protein